MLDFLCGLDTEFSDMVDGSHLYFPSAVQLEDVILPQDQKKLIVETVENFAAYKKVRKVLGLDKTGWFVFSWSCLHTPDIGIDSVATHRSL